MAQQTADDWFCPKCDSYVSSESVTYEETHQICGTGVIIKETKHMAQQKKQQKKLLSEVMEADQKSGLYDNHIGDTNKMVTAVEWLEEQLKKQGFLYDLDIEAAKQMEKKQKIDFAKHCLDRALDLDIRTAFFNVEEYYIKTYCRKSEILITKSENK